MASKETIPTEQGGDGNRGQNNADHSSRLAMPTTMAARRWRRRGLWSRKPVWVRTSKGRGRGERGKVLSIFGDRAVLRNFNRRAGSRSGSPLTDVGDRVRRAFEASHDGWSLDEVLLSDERRRRVIEAVRQTMPDAEEKLVWEWLIGLRKAGKLDVATTRRVYHDLDAYLPLAEIVARRMQDELTVDF